jgi:hypothetical protein
VTTSCLPGLESGDDDKETGNRSALARGSLAAGARCHEADAGDPADAAPDEDREEEITRA